MGRLGLAVGTVKITSHDKKWRAVFIKERFRLKNLFSLAAINIQHIGSTAIPGLPAKPIIDLAVGINNLKIIKPLNAQLIKLGYHRQPKAGTPNKRIFYAKGPTNRRTHYLHIVKYGGTEWNNLLLFRDYLRRHSRVMRQYGALKIRLAGQYANRRPLYTSRKNRFINQIIKLANQK
jgi:GrpB-like predicted nucleotidyltransferase (UPF0157 family)